MLCSPSEFHLQAFEKWTLLCSTSITVRVMMSSITSGLSEQHLSGLSVLFGILRLQHREWLEVVLCGQNSAKNFSAREKQFLIFLYFVVHLCFLRSFLPLRSLNEVINVRCVWKMTTAKLRKKLIIPENVNYSKPGGSIHCRSAGKLR